MEHFAALTLIVLLIIAYYYVHNKIKIKSTDHFENSF